MSQLNTLINEINFFLKNPLTIWLKLYFKRIYILVKYRKKKCKIGYLSSLNECEIGNYNTIYNNVKISNSSLGDYVYIADNSVITNTSIGNFCSIGPNVKIVLGIHPTNHVSTFPAFFSTRGQCQISFCENNLIEELGTVIVGNDVWIGANSIILDNVTIGDGAIIAAGSVVTKDVPPYEIVGGIPARSIKKRFTESQIENLARIKWWEKDIIWIKNKSRLFRDIDLFLKDEV